MSENFDTDGMLPGEDSPLMQETYKKWTIRELHLFEFVEVARKTLLHCLVDPTPSVETFNEIEIEELFQLFAKILQLTQKSKRYPRYKTLLKFT